jgi:hypothetical protein
MIFTNKRAKPRITYTKTECLKCDSILSVQWQQEYVGIFPVLNYLNKTLCSFCKSTQIKTLKINEKEFTRINKIWDLTDSAREDDTETNSWLCETCEGLK